MMPPSPWIGSTMKAAIRRVCRAAARASRSPKGTAWHSGRVDRRGAVRWVGGDRKRANDLPWNERSQHNKPGLPVAIRTPVSMPLRQLRCHCWRRRPVRDPEESATSRSASLAGLTADWAKPGLALPAPRGRRSPRAGGCARRSPSRTRPRNRHRACRGRPRVRYRRADEGFDEAALVPHPIRTGLM